MAAPNQEIHTPWICRWFGHVWHYGPANPINPRCLRCGWFRLGPNPNAHTGINYLRRWLPPAPLRDIPAEGKEQ